MRLWLICCLGPFSGAPHTLLPVNHEGGEDRHERDGNLREVEGEARIRKASHSRLVLGSKSLILKPEEEAITEEQRESVCVDSPLGLSVHSPWLAQRRVRSFQVSRWDKTEDSRDPGVVMRRAEDVRSLRLEGRGGLQQWQEGWRPESKHRGNSHFEGSQVRPEASSPAASMLHGLTWVTVSACLAGRRKGWMSGVLWDWVFTAKKLS